MKAREKLGLMLAMTDMISAQSAKEKQYDTFIIENPYINTYKDMISVDGVYQSKPTRKSNLTPKQKKSRNKAKLARKARKQNR